MSHLANDGLRAQQLPHRVQSKASGAVVDAPPAAAPVDVDAAPLEKLDDEWEQRSNPLVVAAVLLALFLVGAGAAVLPEWLAGSMTEGSGASEGPPADGSTLAGAPLIDRGAGSASRSAALETPPEIGSLNGLPHVPYAFLTTFEVPGLYDLVWLPQGEVNLEIPAQIRALDGEQIYLDGWGKPLSLGSETADQFVLYPDQATCCFGREPLAHEFIEGTEVVPMHVVDGQLARFRGTFEVGPFYEGGVFRALYRFRADRVEPLGPVTFAPGR